MKPRFRVGILHGTILASLAIITVGLASVAALAQTTPWNTNGNGIWYAPSGINVGIGTANPQTTLDVRGPSSASSFTGITRLGTSLRGTDPAYYTGIDFTVGSNVPWSRIGMKYTSGGTYLQFGTLNN